MTLNQPKPQALSLAARSWHIVRDADRRAFVTLGTLALILAVGGALRFWDLDRRGYIVPDERYLARHAGEFVSKLKTMTLSVRTQAERRQKIAELVGLIKHINNALAKPGHEVLSAVAFGLFKRRHPPLYMSALLGALSVGIVFLIGRRLFGSHVGLAAAGYLAISPFHVTYSRSALAQANALFFAMMAVWCYLESLECQRRYRWLVATGVLTGAAFTAHFGMGVVVLFLLAYEVVRGLRRREGLGSWALLAAAMLLPLVVFEGLYVVGKIYTGGKVLTYSNSYFLALGGSFLAGTTLGGIVAGGGFNPWTFPFEAYGSIEGFIVLILMGGGLLWALVRWVTTRQRGEGFVITLFAFFYLPWVFMGPIPFARQYISLSLMVSLAVALVLIEVPRRVLARANPPRPWVRWALVGGLSLLLLVSLGPKTRQVIAVTSPLPIFTDYLRKHRVTKVATIGQRHFMPGVDHIRVHSWDEALDLHERGEIDYFINTHLILAPEKFTTLVEFACGEVLAYPSPYNFRFYQYEGFSRTMMALWDRHGPVKSVLVDLRRCPRRPSTAKSSADHPSRRGVENQRP